MNCVVGIGLFAAGLSLPLVFCLGVYNCLPLHICRRVRAATVEWLDVVDHIARTLAAMLAGARAGRHALEIMFSCGAARVGRMGWESACQ